MKKNLLYGAAICCMLMVSTIAIGQEIVKDVSISSEVAKVQMADLTPNSYFIEVGGPNGYYHKETVDFTNEISLGNVNAKGEKFEDGLYSLQVTPVFTLTEEQRSALTEMRDNNDEEGMQTYREAHNLPSRVDKFLMNFSIKNGNFVISTQQEGELNLPTKSGQWELNHPSLYASVNTVGLEYSDNATDNSAVTVDQCFADDVIVDGSICVGFDCVCNETFGFDTERLKENNLRIHFDDTSNSGSFPANDWRIVINDTTNGGASYFGIEDSSAGRIPFRVEAGAPANSLYVEADGDVGIKTANPVVDLHIVEGNTPTVRLEQDGSSGFTAQTWDLAGNEANFFIRDVTNGSRLSFRIRPGAPESSIDIASSGNVGMGTSSPDAQLDVEDTGTVEVRVTSTDGTSPTAQLVLKGFNTWETRSLADGDYVVRRDGVGGPVPFRIGATADANLLQIGETATNTVHVNGNITATGTITPDYVFEPEYKLESIEEHSAFMFKEKHLPALEPAKTDGNGKGLVNLVNRSQQVLEELEKAHLYIDQLNNSLKAKDAQLNELQQQMIELQQRLVNIEAKLGQ